MREKDVSTLFQPQQKERLESLHAVTTLGAIQKVRPHGVMPISGRRAMMGCVNLVLEIRPTCGQGRGEGGSKNPKLLRTYLMDGPLDKHAPHV